MKSRSKKTEKRSAPDTTSESFVPDAVNEFLEVLARAIATAHFKRQGETKRRLTTKARNPCAATKGSE